MAISFAEVINELLELAEAARNAAAELGRLTELADKGDFGRLQNDLEELGRVASESLQVADKLIK